MIRALVAALAVSALCAFAAPVPARAETCDDLWYARNEIYKAQGYCFRTRRGIAAFGNCLLYTSRRG